MLFPIRSGAAGAPPWSYEMNASPTLRRPLSLVAAIFLPLLLAACGRVPGQFEILNDQIPAAGCEVPVNPTVYQGIGRLDLSIARANADSAYLFFPLIENNLPASKNSAQDPNQIQLTGFNIDITPLSGTSPDTNTVLIGNALAHFRTAWSGGVASGGAQISAIVDAFPVALAEQLLNQGSVGNDPSAVLNLSIQALGTTTFGNKMQSDPFNFPLEICVGCLVANVQPCPFTSTPANPGNACNPAQDAPVDCCTANGALVCPPPVATQ